MTPPLTTLALGTPSFRDRLAVRDPGFGVQAAHHEGTHTDAMARMPMPATVTGSFLELDPPDHTRLRRLVAPAFRPRVVRSWAPRIEAVLHRLVDDLDPTGFDVMADLAGPFPIAVISAVLGIPDADAARFRAIGAVVGQSLDGVRTIRQADRLRAAGLELEALQTAGLLLVAGFETTVNLLGNGLAALHAHPPWWARLVADPDLAPRVVEETLRFDPPVHATSRIAHTEVRLAGTAIPAGATLLVAMAAANRDAAAHPDPATFDPLRTGEPEHLTFAAGLHYCLGAPLARLEGEIAFRVLAQRLPGLRLLRGARRRPGATIRGYATLPASA